MPNIPPVPGTIVPTGALVTPGGAQGASGPIGANGPTVVSADAGNLATLGSDNLISVPQSSIWAMRTRSFNAIGNPNMEVDQVRCGAVSGNLPTATRIIDRYICGRVGTLTCSGQQVNANITLPNSNYLITQQTLVMTLTTAQASLAATDYYYVVQTIEGPVMRELLGDVHSFSILAQTNVSGGLKFALNLRDSPATRCLIKLCTIPAANQWTLIPLPNLPIFPPAGNWSLNSGAIGYQLGICLAAGSSYITPANDSWQNGNFIGAVGQDNFGSKPLNSTLTLAFIQHEPGPYCSTLIDCPFGRNLDGDMGCLRYYQKSYPYAVQPGTVSSQGIVNYFCPVSGTNNPVVPVRFPKIMAKVPTMTAYSNATGAAAAIRDGTTPADRAVSGANSQGDQGFNGFNITGAAAGTLNYQFHYVADTGW